MAVAGAAAVGAFPVLAAQTPARVVPAPCGVSWQSARPALAWQGTPALRWASWSITVGRPALPLRLIVVELDPRHWRWSLDRQRVAGVLQPWRLDDLDDSVVVALNAGQFTDDGPWGWLVHEGIERQVPGAGPLAGAVVVDHSGTVALYDADEIAAVRQDASAHEAWQSFPTLLDRRGRVPAALCASRDGVDPAHRDIRFAVGLRPDGRVLLVLSRLDTDVPLADRTPVGPTTREMAAALHTLGARRALLLDGGLSAQLLVRVNGRTRRWPGLRAVPLGVVLRPR
jgi:uncharacterized protein YigE (DUF2233 family)